MPMLPMHSDIDCLRTGPVGTTFGELKTFIVNATGHVRLAERDDLLLEKISRRIRCRGLPSLESYLALLKRGAAGRNEFDCLIAELTIGETAFFRHPDQFDALRDHVLPACLKRNRDTRQLRIWSAGCANGAEAYSIAIIVHALLGDRLNQWNVVIVGSDINRAFLAEAERGQYSAWTLRDVADEQRSAFFARQSDGWSIRDRYKRHVRYVYHNLVSGEFPCFDRNIFAFDIIMCRNVMIYFDGFNNKQLAARLRIVLVDDGWLFTGPADFNPHLDSTFTLEKLSGALIYRNRTAAMRSTAAPPAAEAAAEARTVGAQAPSPSRRDPSTAKRGGTRLRIRDTARGAATGPRRPASAPQPNIETIIDLANKGDWTAATHYCEEFLQADACNAPAHYYYALVQQYSGAAAAAEQALKRAIYLDGNFALAHYQLGLVRKDAHDAALCSRSFQNVLAALRDVADDVPVSPCGQITARDVRELATQQLDLLGRRPAKPS